MKYFLSKNFQTTVYTRLAPFVVYSVIVLSCIQICRSMCELIMIIAGCINVAANYVQLLRFHARFIARCLAIWLYTCAYEGRKMLTCIACKLTIYVHVASYVEVKRSLWIHRVSHVEDWLPDRFIWASANSLHFESGCFSRQFKQMCRPAQ